jgi:AraC family transcriptional regulator, regulatory protein of adaptative response / methylated-DNA-[protein]-cysteine methyltransferase
MLTMSERWKAVQTRDPTADGRFVYAVVSTGVYCRPNCASRRPLRQNVRFFATAQQARAAGFRACLRCTPDQAQPASSRADAMHAIARYAQAHAEDPLTVDDLARRAKLTRFHFQRTFKKALGVTPKAYLAACRLRVLKTHLRREPNVTAAIYQAGYGSSSRVYENVDTRLGMTPSEYRSGGAGLAISYGFAQTPLGLLLIAATDRGLCALQFGDTREALAAALRLEYPSAALAPMPVAQAGEFASWVARLNEHLRDSSVELDLPLDVRGTAFQLTVWQCLQRIPSGEVRSYAEVAAAIGQPRGARAVARACATNRLALVIPCHRVIRGSGELGGYRWGLERKRVLLDRERAARGAQTRRAATP